MVKFMFLPKSDFVTVIEIVCACLRTVSVPGRYRSIVKNTLTIYN